MLATPTSCASRPTALAGSKRLASVVRVADHSPPNVKVPARAARLDIAVLAAVAWLRRARSAVPCEN
jgi:hypothetical protein